MEKRRLIVFLIGVFLIASLGIVSAVDISTCQTLSADTTYDLTGNVTANVNSMCFSISQSNVTLDCNGYSIIGNSTSNLKYGIWLTGDNNNIRNCNFHNWSFGTDRGMHISGSNEQLDNLTFSQTGTYELAIYGGTNITANNLTLEDNLFYIQSTSDNITLNHLIGRLNILDTASNILINNWDASGGSMQFASTTLDISINNADIHHMTSSFSILGTNINITNSTFRDHSQATVFSNAKNIFLDNITGYNLTSATYSFGNGAATGIENLTIINSNFQNNTELEFYGQGSLNNKIIFENNTFYDTELIITDGLNDSIFRYNNLSENSSIEIKGINNQNLTITNNRILTNLDDYCITINGTSNFNISNNHIESGLYGITTLYSDSGEIHDNLLYTVDHGVSIDQYSNNITGYGNLINNSNFGFLFRYGAHNNTFYNNNQTSGGIFYSLHHTHDNRAYNNYIEGDLILHDNVTREYFYNNTVTGDLIFRWDLAYTPEGIGAFNNTIQDTIVSGNLEVKQNSMNNTLINVSVGGTKTVDATNLSSYQRKSYLDTSTNINNTNITITNSSGDVFFSELVNGSIDRQTLLSYINEGGTQTNYSNYTITASATGYVTNTTEFNLTDNVNLEFTLTATPTTTTEEATSTSGGGGTPTKYPTESNLQEGYSQSLGRLWKVSFEHENESHQLKIEKLYSNNKSATITISSEPQTKTISVGEEWKVNLNNDSYYDLLVRLDNVTSVRANVFMQEINESISGESEEVEQEPQEGEPETTTKDTINYGLYSGIAVLVLIVGFLVYFFINKSKKKKK
jgi:hypothetical protein